MDLQKIKVAPWLVFQHGKRERSQTFFNMAIGSYSARSTRQMRKKAALLSSHGWLLLRDSSGRFCLFNPISLTEFKVPHLTERSRDCIYVLSAPPTDPNCQLILMKKKASVFYFCRITQDCNFIEVKYDLLDKYGGFCRAVSCEGKTYFHTNHEKVGVIDVDSSKCFPTIRLLDVERPIIIYHPTVMFLIESFGEVFLVYQISHGLSNCVIDFIVFKMDFSQMRWVKVGSIGDRLFLLGESPQSCSASKSGLEGDQILFFLPDDISLYSFHMKQRSISIDLICPNVQPPWKTPFWVMHTSNEVKANMEKIALTNVNIKVDMEKIEPINTNMKVDRVKMAEETAVKISIDERPWSDLLTEIILSIRIRLTPLSSARMRSICRSWRSILPPVWFPQTPCLIFREEISGLCKFFDPLNKRVYAADIPQLHGATSLSSKGSWLLVCFDEHNIIFFNPFTREIIDLPEFPGLVTTISFSSMPKSPDCVVFVVFNMDPFCNILIYTCSPGARTWKTYLRDLIHPHFHVGSTNPVFHKGLFYCLGQEGNLGVYDVSQGTWNVLKNPRPLQLPIGCCFLIEAKGELLFVYYRRAQIYIFTLDESRMVWVEAEGMEDIALFLSQSSSLAAVVDKEAKPTALQNMKNKIYTSRIRHGSNDALCYSMGSMSHHLDLYESKEFIDCTWIEPMGFDFSLDSQGNISSVTSRYM